MALNYCSAASLSHLSTAQWEQHSKDRQCWGLGSCLFSMGNLSIRTRSSRKGLLQKICHF